VSEHQVQVSDRFLVLLEVWNILAVSVLTGMPLILHKLSWQESFAQLCLAWFTFSTQPVQSWG